MEKKRKNINGLCVFFPALIVNGIYKLATGLNKQPPLTQEQAIKFANYFLSRKSVQTPKGVWSLLEALQIFSTNKVS